MKEVPKKQLTEISGGDVPVGTNPQLPNAPGGVEYPRNPFSPVCEAPLSEEDWQGPALGER